MDTIETVDTPPDTEEEDKEDRGEVESTGDACESGVTETMTSLLSMETLLTHKVELIAQRKWIGGN